jgi:hypothetical protein
MPGRPVNSGGSGAPPALPGPKICPRRCANWFRSGTDLELPGQNRGAHPGLVSLPLKSWFLISFVFLRVLCGKRSWFPDHGDFRPFAFLCVLCGKGLCFSSAPISVNPRQEVLLSDHQITRSRRSPDPICSVKPLHQFFQRDDLYRTLRPIILPAHNQIALFRIVEML